ncbi:MAG: hypothetical protein ABEJ42_02020 [Halobacteriaceae archaeon]
MSRTRRRFLTGSLVAAVASTAGCAGLGGQSGDSGGTTTDDGGSPTGTAAPITTASDDGVYVVAHDIVRGNIEGVDQQAMVGALASRFRPGQKVVWRIAVVDGETGEEVSPATVDDVSVVVEGETTIEAKYGVQPLESELAEYRESDRFYSASWIIPDDYPSGAVSYSIEVDAERPVHVVHFDTETSQLYVRAAPPIDATTTAGTASTTTGGS